MQLRETLIAYNPGTDQIRVGRLLHLGDADWTRHYSHTCGAAFLHVRKMTGFVAQHYVMSEFIGITVRDHVCINAAHKAFMEIDEYRKAIPADMSGGIT